MGNCEWHPLHSQFSIHNFPFTIPPPPLSPFTCPVCRLPLKLVGHSLSCEQGHLFDRAREGYVNLWVGHKRPFLLGDSAEMVQARRRFLEAGYYDPLYQQVQMVVQQVADGAEGVIADVGCGEGYGIGRLQQQWSQPVLPMFAGVDVSKTAVRLAAKKYTAVHFAVSDIWQQLPFTTHAVQLLLNLFAPRNSAEFGRVVKPGGWLVVVIPDPAHLDSLRQRLPLLQIEAEKRERITTQLTAFFTLQAVYPLRHTLSLPAPALQDLITMTPNARHLSPAQSTELGTAETEAAFEILLFRRGE